MNYRRYYPRGSKKKYVLSDEQFDEMIEKYGFEMAVEKDNACIELIPESKEEAIKLFLEGCQRIYDNPRYYLDNLDQIPTFNIKILEYYSFLDKNGSKTETFINRKL